MSNKAKTQYNGMILLTGYLQRLFVVETIYQRLKVPHEAERLEQVKFLIDETHKILPVFEKTKTLTEVQRDELHFILRQIENLMADYFKESSCSFNEKLAIAGSSLYAEQHVNKGIIRLGEVFNQEINKDFHKRIQFYEQRTKMIDYLVHTLAEGKEPEEQFMKPVEPWFDNVMQNKELILKDIKQIEKMIEI
ncbi:transcriptional regulator [Lysinibacillus sp. BW-2-10]|uniref:transcriptional regulator n=1 Tax=Lysinibacillus sp. BW-2-10 TaxID=2590030 RepID=UPI00117FEFAB|nr:transcriptional regulator [Lysinibacillus sp. BW-2-10]TSI05267.1 transcriptional regulator [Lysinibacillus sp. BW-2-10]